MFASGSAFRSVELNVIGASTAGGGIKDRIDVQHWNKLPLYLQDDLQREQNFK